MRRLKCQMLALLRQHRLKLRQRGSGAHGDDQLAWLVGDDAAQRAGVEDVPLKLLAVEVLAAAAADTQGRTGRGGRSNLVREAAHFAVHRHHGSA